MIRRKSAVTVAALATIGLTAPLFAAPADMVRSRIDGFREVGASFKAINDALRSPSPQTMLIQISARQLVNYGNAMKGWFPAGSGAESGAKTRAKREIWAQPAQFQKAIAAYNVQAQALQRAANANNVAAIRTEAAKLAATCKGCHDSFRVPGN